MFWSLKRLYKTVLGPEWPIQDILISGMSEGKKYKAHDVLLQFFRPFVERVTDEEIEYSVIGIHRMFSEFECWKRRKGYKEKVTDEMLVVVIEEARKFEALMKEMLDVHCK